MTLGERVQSVIGLVGILATLAVAWMVYRLEKKDRLTERSADRRREEQHRHEEQEREHRMLRREQHKEDYLAATRALDVIASAMESAQIGAMTSDEVEALDLKAACTTVDRISDRIPGLFVPLKMVSLQANKIQTSAFPSVSSFRYAVSDGDKEVTANRMQQLFKDACKQALHQFRAGIDGTQAIEEARKAIAREWGS